MQYTLTIHVYRYIICIWIINICFAFIRIRRLILVSWIISRIE